MSGPNLHTENHEGPVMYPVYGINKNMPNRNGCCLEQFIHNKYVLLVDLRTFEDTGLPKVYNLGEEDSILVGLLRYFYLLDHQIH